MAFNLYWSFYFAFFVSLFIHERVRLPYSKDGKKENKLQLTFANQGTAHALLSNLRLSLAPIGKESNPIKLEAKQLTGVNGENMLAGSKRRFSLPCPVGLPNEKLSGTFEYDRSN